MRLIRVEGCSLNIKSRHNFVVVIHISLFININSYLFVVRHVRATHVRFTIGVSNSFIITRMLLTLNMIALHFFLEEFGVFLGWISNWLLK
jgi:hypothetical protein